MRQGNAKRRRERRRRKIRRMAAGMGMFLILAAVLPAAGRIRQQGSGAAEAERCLQSLKEKGED